MSEIVRQSIAPDVNLSVLTTGKFKTSVLSLSLLRPLSREEASLSALVPPVLCRGTSRYPDMAALSARLEELYGARLEPAARKKGEIQCAGFVSDFIDGAYLPGHPDQLRAVAELLGEMLLNPAGGGRFVPDYVEAERGQLADQIAAAKNDKRAYASHRLLELMCADEAYGVNRLGDEARARAIPPDRLWEHYRDMLASSRVELLYIGPRSAGQVAETLSGALSGLPRRVPALRVGTDVIRSAAGPIRHFEESMDVEQGKLAMGARLGVSAADPAYPAALLAVEVFGGTTVSKLFLHVREHLQLCYYASAHMEALKGLMIVSSGIDFQKREAAEQEISRQWEAICRGEITDEELSAARLSLISQLRASVDQPHRMEDYYLGQMAAGLSDSPDALASRLEAVTADQTAGAARAATWDSVYFLHG